VSSYQYIWVASECICDWLRDATGLYCGDWSWICNAPLDFRKAFDKVLYHRLLQKLRAHGITGTIISWIENWLGGREQRIVINGICSSFTAVINGVPQGSILSPLLFKIFINDLDDGVISKILKFVDDAKIVRKVADEIRLRYYHQIYTILERCNSWPHVANRHISISQLLSLWHHFHNDVIRASRAYCARSPCSHYDVILIVMSFATELATPTVTDVHYGHLTAFNV